MEHNKASENPQINLFREETSTMWKAYRDDGVAICSRYGQLKSALSTMNARATWDWSGTGRNT